jgi:protein required for attachment to host cells
MDDIRAGIEGHRGNRMRLKKMTTWVVLADGARARILENTGPGTGLVELEAWESAEARKPTRELGTERPGRGHESATEGRHAIAPHSDWHEAEKANFASDLARYLKQHGDAGKFDELVLAASPRTLGELRKSIDPATADRVTTEINKDLTNIPMAEIGSHLEEAVRL